MKCDNCLNKSICKYTDNMARVESEISKIVIYKEAPIIANVQCNMYRSNSHSGSTLIDQLNKYSGSAKPINAVNETTCIDQK